MKKYLTLLSLIFIWIACTTSPEEKSDYYGLRLTDIHNWQTNFSSGGFQVTIDKTVSVNGKHPICISQMQLVKKRMPMTKADFGQLLLLPETEREGNIEVSIHCRSLNVEKANLKITGLDERGHYLKSQQVAINNSDEWATYTARIQDKRIRFLRIAIFIENSLDEVQQKLWEPKRLLVFDSIENEPEPPEQKMWLDEIRVFVDDFDMKMFDPDQLKELQNVSLDRKAIVPISGDNFDLIEPLKDKRIVCIGESMHGTTDFSEIEYEVGNCANA